VLLALQGGAARSGGIRDVDKRHLLDLTPTPMVENRGGLHRSGRGGQRIGALVTCPDKIFE
jgi:hypothetical protein